MFNTVLDKAPVFLVIFARCFALLMTMPLFSMRSVPRVAKLALGAYMAFFLMGTVNYDFYNVLINEDGTFSLLYILVLGGEVLIGVLLGLYVTMIFAAFSTAGQFIAFQMGFSAASTYDALAQVENPLMGQYFNFIALFVFMQNGWFQRLFLSGLTSSFKTLNIINIVFGRQKIIEFLTAGLTRLFADAMVISLPIMGTLLLITVCTGLLSKAAPQMNLLSEGFPVMILLSFVLIDILLEPLTEFFVNGFNTGFSLLQEFFVELGGRI